jgi:hypothetical protein
MTTSSPLLSSRAAVILQQSPIPALRRLAVEETDTSVLLMGSVPSYYYKQLAQEAVMPTLEGRELINHVTVV